MTLSADGDADRGNTQANINSTALAARLVDGPRLSAPDKAAQRLADWLIDLAAGQAAAIAGLVARFPLANTILVNRADRHGLSELYQLRGRVGRSNRRAYSYLLIPPETELTEIARRRLAALKEFSDLGAGFRIAAVAGTEREVDVHRGGR